MRELSEQEQFWRGDFGDEYAGRNQGQPLIAANLALFTKALARTSRLESLLELGTNVWQGSLFDYPRERTFQLTLSKGVLIHLVPDLLPAAYKQLYQLSQRYILICEYYNPVPVEVSYRGNSGKLFKRDFAGELLDRYSDLQLLDYGFSYRRDPQLPTDDINWFLLEKRS